jgi:hypothetical protein
VSTPSMSRESRGAEAPLLHRISWKVLLYLGEQFP